MFALPTVRLLLRASTATVCRMAEASRKRGASHRFGIGRVAWKDMQETPRSRSRSRSSRTHHCLLFRDDARESLYRSSRKEPRFRAGRLAVAKEAVPTSGPRLLWQRVPV